MKNLLIASLLIISTSAFAAEAKKDQHSGHHTEKSDDPKIKVPVVELKKDTSSAPCQQTQEQIMKELEEKKKAASSGKTAGLQGLGTPGCTVK